MTYKPGAEWEENDDEEGVGAETPPKPKCRHTSHQKHKPYEGVATEHESQSLSMSVKIPHPATSTVAAAAAATDHGAHLAPADAACSPPKKARKGGGLIWGTREDENGSHPLDHVSSGFGSRIDQLSTELALVITAHAYRLRLLHVCRPRSIRNQSDGTRLALVDGHAA